MSAASGSHSRYQRRFPDGYNLVNCFSNDYTLPLYFQDCCKKEDGLEGLLENISSLVHTLDAKEDPQMAIAKVEVVEIVLPAPLSLSEQFNSRMVFELADAEEERVSTSYWLGPPPTDEADPEQEMVSELKYSSFREDI